MDTITLTGMEFRGYHACLPEERREGQIFYVDAVLFVNLQPAGESDDLTKTVNYADAFEVIRGIVEGKPQNLIEAVAERIATAVLDGFAQVAGIAVTVHKPSAPIAGTFRDVSVHIERKRVECVTGKAGES